MSEQLKFAPGLEEAAIGFVRFTASEVARGVNRLLISEGMSPLIEFSLPNGRRMDVAGLGNDGAIVGVEIKVSLADLSADDKWPDYLPYCDLFYFAVPPEFPHERVPASSGLMVADRFGGSILRPAKRNALHATRRKALTLRFAQIAAERLARAFDPNCI
ncbi:MAG TPA: MmcB family DNA repair protein [Micropepsaceae bacterium]|nr:MmcB family DNA repair protein [Micropepsaceae bacterium]